MNSFWTNDSTKSIFFDPDKNQLLISSEVFSAEQNAQQYIYQNEHN